MLTGRLSSFDMKQVSESGREGRKKEKEGARDSKLEKVRKAPRQKSIGDDEQKGENRLANEVRQRERKEFKAKTTSEGKMSSSPNCFLSCVRKGKDRR